MEGIVEGDFVKKGERNLNFYYHYSVKGFFVRVFRIRKVKYYK